MPTTVIKTIGVTGRDFATVAAWESATQGDLVAADEIRIGEMHPDADFNEEVVIAGSTVDATRFRELRAVAGSRHHGIKSAGVVWKKTTASDNPVIDIQEAFFRMTHIEFTDWKVLTQFGTAQCVEISADDIRLGYLLFHTPSIVNDPVARAINHPFGGADAIIFNCIIQEMNAAGINRGIGIQSNDAAKVYNCTIRDTQAFAGSFSAGFKDGGTNVEYINCVAENAHDGANTDDFPSTTSANSKNNAGSDTSAPGVNSIDNITSAEFVSASDSHLDAASQLIDAGLDPASVFTDDVDEQQRPGVPADWGMGADEIIVGGGARRVIICVNI